MTISTLGGVGAGLASGAEEGGRGGLLAQSAPPALEAEAVARASRLRRSRSRPRGQGRISCSPSLGRSKACARLHGVWQAHVYEACGTRGNLSRIAVTVLQRSCSYCASLSETLATPCPRQRSSLVLGSITSMITVPWVYCETVGCTYGPKPHQRGE